MRFCSGVTSPDSRERPLGQVLYRIPIYYPVDETIDYVGNLVVCPPRPYGLHSA
jgi:hypothetical protein